MSNRDNIIDRIRKLRRMTEAAGASENEALLAAAQVAKLIAQWNVDESELRLRADSIGLVDDSYSMPGTVTVFHTLVAKSIARFTHTKLRWRTLDEDMFGLGVSEPWTYVKFYGYPLDVEASIALSAICQTSIITESAQWEKANPFPKLTSRARARVAEHENNRLARKQSFFLGICERLSERIAQFEAATPTSSGTSLMILKNELVDQHYADFLRSRDLGLHVARVASIRLDVEAYVSGRKAAENIDLQRNERLSA